MKIIQVGSNKAHAILILLFVLTIQFATAQEIEYFKGSVSELKEKSNRTGKIYYIDFYTSWCGWCKKMDQTTFKDKGLIEYVDNNLYAYKLDAESIEGKEIAHEQNVSGFPTVVFFNAKGENIGVLRGYKTAQQFLLFAKQMVKAHGSSDYEEPLEIDPTALFEKKKKELWQKVKDQYDSLGATSIQSAYNQGENRSVFQFEEMLYAIPQEAPYRPLLKLVFLLGANDNDFKEELKRLFEDESLSTTELHYFSVSELIDQQVSIETLRMINSVALSNPTYETLLAKAVIQNEYGDTKDAKSTLKKAKKMASKQGLEAKELSSIDF